MITLCYLFTYLLTRKRQGHSQNKHNIARHNKQTNRQDQVQKRKEEEKVWQHIVNKSQN